MTFHGDKKMTAALKHIKEFETEGEQKKFLDEYFGDDEDDDNRRGAVKCLHCRDTGWATIYHPITILKAAQGKEVKSWRTCALRCKCEEGMKKPSHSRRNKFSASQAQPTFRDQPWHISANDPDGKGRCATFDLNKLRHHEPEEIEPEERKPYA
jgi:hypothetical protein